MGVSDCVPDYDHSNLNKTNKVFITGITGMVGSHLTDFLLKNTDWKIYGLARWTDSLDNLEHTLSQQPGDEKNPIFISSF